MKQRILDYYKRLSQKVSVELQVAMIMWFIMLNPAHDGLTFWNSILLAVAYGYIFQKEVIDSLNGWKYKLSGFDC